MSHFRRILLAILIFIVAGWIYKLWRDRQPDAKPGLFELFSNPEALQSTKKTGSIFESHSALEQLDKEISELAQRVLPTVVSIDSQNLQEKRVSRLTRSIDIVPSLGSGVIITPEGHVLTNYHVISNALEIRVTTNDQKSYKATLVGANPKADIAVIQIQEPDGPFPVLPFGDSDKVKVGQTVFAVGNPFGLSGSFTQGIICARRTSQNGVNILQTDTVINPGNSGGPLINTNGEIIGINFSIYRGDERLRTWQGVGLAIPANDAKAVADAIMQQGSKPVGFLGIVTDEVVLRMPGGKIGITINEVVPNSPADKAGLRPDDVIIGINGEPLEFPEEVYYIALATPIGRPIKLEIMRGQQVLQITAVIQPRPQK